MFEIYDKQRKHLGEKLQHEIITATQQAQKRVESETKFHVEKMEYLTKVTEDYVKRGYLDLNEFRWRSCGSFSNASSYVRQLARDMKRPFITLRVENAGTAYNHETNSYLSGRWAAISMPNTLKLAPLYAHLEMVLVSRDTLIGNRPGLQMVSRDTSVKTRRLYFFRSCATEYGAFGDAPEAPVHPLITYFKQQVETDPVVRRLLKLPVE